MKDVGEKYSFFSQVEEERKRHLVKTGKQEQSVEDVVDEVNLRKCPWQEKTKTKE